jgi:hypothetical protein
VNDTNLWIGVATALARFSEALPHQRPERAVCPLHGPARLYIEWGELPVVLPMLGRG